MNYYISSPVLDAQIKEIRQKIRLSMNGIASEQMTLSGIVYKKNYGVAIPRLKEIANLFEKNYDLAQRLWTLKIRETMILATLLQPVDNFIAEMANRWAESFNQPEIIEQSCMNLFCKLPFANTLSVQWISLEDKWMQVAGFLLAARICEKLNQSEIEILIHKAVQISETEDFQLYKSISVCLSRLCRKDKDTAAYLLTTLNPFSDSSSAGQQFILNEVKQEILFLGSL